MRPTSRFYKVFKRSGRVYLFAYIEVREGKVVAATEGLHFMIGWESTKVFGRIKKFEYQKTHMTGMIRTPAFSTVYRHSTSTCEGNYDPRTGQRATQVSRMQAPL